MRPRTFWMVKVLLDLGDCPVIFAALLLAYEVRFRSGWFSISQGIPDLSGYVRAAAVLAASWCVLFWLTGIYQTRGRFTSDRAFALTGATVQAAFLSMALAFLYRGHSYSRLTLVLAVVLALASLLVYHALKMNFLRWLYAREIGSSRVLLVGGGDLARACRQRLATGEEPSLKVVGYVGEADSPLASDLPCLGTTDAVTDVIRDHLVDEVLIALPSRESDRILDILTRIEVTSAQVTIVPDIFGILAATVHPGRMAGLPVIQLGQLPIHGFQGRIKHALDFVLALLGLIVLAIPMLIVAWWVKRDSPGPALYAQERIGLDGRTFIMYKFRSMVAEAEKETGPKWAQPDDPRRTRLGAWLRKYSVDELPQLYNVLRGEMSLVGPRPERPVFVRDFSASVPRYMGRHRVRSGITGWAQIRGLRGQSPIEERTRYDIWYIENWSLLLDVRILLETIIVCIFKPTGY